MARFYLNIAQLHPFSILDMSNSIGSPRAFNSVSLLEHLDSKVLKLSELESSEEKFSQELRRSCTISLHHFAFGTDEKEETEELNTNSQRQVRRQVSLDLA